MTALPAGIPSPPARPEGPDGGDGYDENAIPGTLTAAAAAVVGTQPPQFRYWVDELLWSQGRTATIQLEEVVDAMGGVRTGGPHKLLSSSKGSSPVSSALDLQQLQQGLDAYLQPAATIAAASSSQFGRNLFGSNPQPPAMSSTEQVARNYSRESLLEEVQETAIAPAVDAADVTSDVDSSSGVPALAKRSDDSLLGYHHVRKWDFLWTKSVYAIKAARQLQPGQLVSAIAGLNCLTMKKRMVQTLRMALGTQAFSIVPLSFCIPEDLPAWQTWLTSPSAAADTGLWMLKTGQDAGKGLRLVRTQHALQAALRQPKNPNKPQNYIKVAQQYITNPLLIQGRKFHLRLWMVVTSHSPLRAYLYNQGLVLFSSEVYDSARPVDGPGVRPAVGHVTNFARNEDTWVWGLDKLQQQLGQQKWQQLWEQMRVNTALTAAAVLGPMRAAHRWLQPSISNYGFQMLGLDYLVDDQMHPWLLEVNSAPSIMAVHSDPETYRLIKMAKQSMLADMMALVKHRVLLQADDIQGGSSSNSRQVQRLTWQQELELEMSHRGSFEPLMELFPLQQLSIPWQEADLQLQRRLQQQPLQ